MSDDQPSVSLEQLSSLLELLYDGPYEPNPFGSFLKALRPLLGLNLACIILRQPEGNDGGLLFVSSDRLDMTAVDVHGNPYTDTFYAMDPMVGLPHRTVVTLDEVISPEEYERSDYYKICMAAANAYHMAGVDLLDANKQRYTVRLCRPREAPPFSAADKALIGLLAGHIERAVAIGMRLVQLDSERQLYAKTVSGHSIGSVTLNENCRVLRTNGVADRVLGAQDGLSLRGEEILLRQPERNEQLRKLMQELLAAQRREEVVPVHAMRVPRPSGRPDYELVIKAIPVDRYVETRNSPHLLLLISDPDRTPPVSISMLMSLYHLTQTEATLSILLSEGKNLDEVSKELGIARNTARAHLRAIFSKTGVAQQSMLVSLVLKSLASLP